MSGGVPHNQHTLSRIFSFIEVLEIQGVKNQSRYFTQSPICRFRKKDGQLFVGKC